VEHDGDVDLLCNFSNVRVVDFEFVGPMGVPIAMARASTSVFFTNSSAAEGSVKKASLSDTETLSSMPFNLPNSASTETAFFLAIANTFFVIAMFS
jgi:hypothetical protein